MSAEELVKRPMHADLVRRAQNWLDATDGLATVKRKNIEPIVRDLAQALECPVAQPVPVADATRYAEQLAVSLASKHYSEVVQWRPLSGDLIGLLTQIDNMTTGLSRSHGGVAQVEAAGQGSAPVQVSNPAPATTLSATPQPASAGPVVALEWKPNGGKSLWTEELIFGVYYVAYEDGDNWLVERGQFLSEGSTRIAFGPKEMALAAAQADFEKSIRPALSSSPTPVGVSEAMKAAAERVVWFDWSDNDSDAVAAIEALRQALAALRSQPPAPKEPAPGVTEADKIIGQIEERFPGWRGYRDLIDCIDCTLADLRGGAK